MINVQNLSHAYPGKPSPRTALANLNLTVATGEFFVLTGPNGGGKSTLFRILCGLLTPSAGSVTVAGMDILTQPETARQAMGVVFQKPALDKYLTVLENLRIHADLYNLPETRFQQQLERLLAWSNIKNRLHDRVETLSGGLARQVELVKSLLHQPRLLILDEPTTGLDPAIRHTFIQSLLRLQQEDNLTILMTSHIFSEAEAANSVAILQHGKLLARDHPATLRAQLGHEILVIESDDFTPILAELSHHPELKAQQRNGELRVEGPELATLLNTLITRQRRHLRTIAIKQPTLDDVFIHLTGHTPQDEENTR